MARESKPDDPSDGPISKSLEDWKRKVREKLREAIDNGPSTPLTQADWDDVRCELRRRYANRCPHDQSDF
jgi:hypothetical protein